MADLKHIKESIDQIIQIELKLQLEKVILVLSKQYNIDKGEIYRHIEHFDAQLEQRKQTCQEAPIEINSEKCLGKTKYNTQCSRSRQKDSLFCGSHLNKLPYGRVDGASSEKNNGKKRGRPRKGMSSSRDNVEQEEID
jgi:hypothetical protein